MGNAKQSYSKILWVWKTNAVLNAASEHEHVTAWTPEHTIYTSRITHSYTLMLLLLLCFINELCLWYLQVKVTSDERAKTHIIVLLMKNITHVSLLYKWKNKDIPKSCGFVFFLTTYTCVFVFNLIVTSVHIFTLISKSWTEQVF